MSFPCAMTLRNTAEGSRIFRWPVKEITRLYDGRRMELNNLLFQPRENQLAKLKGDLWDIQAEFEIKDASGFGFRIRGEAVTYSVKDKKLRALGREAPLEPENGRVKIRVLVDRTSLETFGNGGRVSLSSCFLPRQRNREIELFTAGGAVKIVSLTAHKLRSIWK